jgi:transposase
MARKRQNRIVESLADLDELEHRSTGLTLPRIRFLRLMKENEGASLSSLAPRTGVKQVTLERWWRTYRTGGIDALLAVRKRGGNRPRLLDEAGIRELRALVKRHELSDAGQVQRWILEEHEVAYSRTGVRDLLASLGLELGRPADDSGTTSLSTGSRHRDRHGTEPASLRANDASADPLQIDSKDLIALLTSLPMEYNVAECAHTLRNMLRLILKDVDRISIDVNTRCDLLDPEGYEPDLMISQEVSISYGNADLHVRRNAEPGAMARYLLENFSAQKISLDIYHTPIWREYYLHDKAYLGTIFLWRERTSPPISDQTVALLDGLHSFIEFLLSDIVTRHHYANHLERIFYDIIETISEECNLNVQERRVLVMRLLGSPYRDIAERLHIAPNTVSKYVCSIYRKTGTRSTIDLFAKYLTPRLIDIDIPIISNR